MGSALPRVIVITDWDTPELLEKLSSVLALGPQVGVQHRHPHATGRTFYEEARALVALARRNHNPVFINGRLDVAIALDAHLHLPSHAYSPEEARPRLPSRLISVSVHDGAEASRSTGCDLALVSPVFAPRSKPFDQRPPLGATGYRALATRLACPAFALGGIEPDEVPKLGGCAGVAVIGSVLTAKDPRATAARLLAAL